MNVLEFGRAVVAAVASLASLALLALLAAVCATSPAWAGGGAIQGPTAKPTVGRQRPNILFIMADDHAAHAIGAYGSRINQTPHLDDDRDIPEPPTLDDDGSGRASPSHTQEMTVQRHLTRTDVKEDPPPGLDAAARKRWHYQRYIKEPSWIRPSVNRPSRDVVSWGDWPRPV